MKEEVINAEDFFIDFDKQERTPLVLVSDHKTKIRAQEAFEDVKVKMVMRIEGCGREEAIRIIDERAAELRAKENAQRNAHNLDFTK